MIVVFGSFNIDVVMSLERLPGPGETVLGGDYMLVPGGKGANQACAAARAAKGSAATIAMIGKIGADDWGDFALARLSEAGVDLDAVARGRSPTGCALICVDAAGENAISVASGANLETEAAQVPERMLGPGHWLVLQMEVPPEENWRLVERARRRDCKVLLNVAPAASVPEDVLEAVDVLVFNEVEGRMLAECAGLAADDPLDIARRLRDSHGVTAVATLGPAGAAAFAPGESWRVAALPVAPVDTTGAGDAFVGNLVVALEAEATLPEALRRASVAAGICCETRGTQSSFPWADQIEDRLAELGSARPTP
ncbi:MAG: ribokinase [Alphaproteobacteria bacterium]